MLGSSYYALTSISSSLRPTLIVHHCSAKTKMKSFLTRCLWENVLIVRSAIRMSQISKVIDHVSQIWESRIQQVINSASLVSRSDMLESPFPRPRWKCNTQLLQCIYVVRGSGVNRKPCSLSRAMRARWLRACLFCGSGMQSKWLSWKDRWRPGMRVLTIQLLARIILACCWEMQRIRVRNW